MGQWPLFPRPWPPKPVATNPTNRERRSSRLGTPRRNFTSHRQRRRASSTRALSPTLQPENSHGLVITCYQQSLLFWDVMWTDWDMSCIYIYIYIIIYIYRKWMKLGGHNLQWWHLSLKELVIDRWMQRISSRLWPFWHAQGPHDLGTRMRTIGGSQHHVGPMWDQSLKRHIFETHTADHPNI